VALTESGAMILSRAGVPSESARRKEQPHA